MLKISRLSVKASDVVAGWCLDLKDWLIGVRDGLNDEATKWIYSFQASGDETPLKDTRRRPKFARMLARQAYLQYGSRPRTAANMLVTRKWLRNYVSQAYPDARLVDKIEAIDEALFLSFIPTDAFVKCSQFAETEAYKEWVPEMEPVSK